MARPERACRAWSRSSPRVRVLTSTVSGVRVPETTLHSDIFPVWLSVKVLVTVSSTSASASQGISVVVDPACTVTGGTEPGSGQSSSISRAKRSTPTPVSPEQHSTGKTAPEATPPARLFSSSP